VQSSQKQSNAIAAVFPDPSAAHSAVRHLLEVGIDSRDIALASLEESQDAGPVTDLRGLELGGMGSAFPDIYAGSKGATDPFLGGSAGQDIEIAASANASAIQGRMTEFIRDYFPAAVAQQLMTAYRDGQTVVAVAHPKPEVRTVLHDAGATDITEQSQTNA